MRLSVGSETSPAPGLPHELTARFREHFGRPPELAARAPGRVNLIGEHTDYNEGLVLPGAIDRDTWLLAARRGDTRFELRSRELPGACAFDAREIAPEGAWGDYARGVVRAFREAGQPTPGLDVLCASRVPVGAGLSSSAALEVAFAALLARAAGLALRPRELAELAHRAETRFVGVRCGLMDQLASALGQPARALRIDCRSLEVTPIPFPAREAELLVVDSGVARRLADGRYNRRREECEEALRLAVERGIALRSARSLRDLPREALAAVERALPDLLARRVRHVLTENERVDALARALEACDLESAGAVLRDGMRSLREDFEVSIPELDFLCDEADGLPGGLGSRLTGAGFGGSTLHLVRAGAAGELGRELAARYRARFGREARPMPVQLGPGAAAFDLGEEGADS